MKKCMETFLISIVIERVFDFLSQNPERFHDVRCKSHSMIVSAIYMCYFSTTISGSNLPDK